MLWSKVNPPIYHKNAVLARQGWTDPKTGEILVAFYNPQIGPGLVTQHIVGKSSIHGTVQQHHHGISNIRWLNIREVQQMVGCTRIICPEPINHGINANW